MIITFNWLREHLKTNLTAKEILETTDTLGLNLKIAYLNNGLWDQLEIVQIINKSKHPNADKLNLYKIKKYNNEELTIVCGDQTLDINDHVIYAKPGIKMPSGLTLKTAKIRDIESQGMLCSASEINLPIQSNKVFRCFEQDFGKTVAQAYDKEGVFEIELTPNKGETFSIRGFANLLANEGFGSLNEYKINKNNALKKELITIKSKKCKGIFCALFKYTPKNTPIEIFKKLQLTNHNPLNIDLVDYTNYLSHELGQPMHIFDYNKIKDQKISIDELKTPQQFETLGNDKIELKKGSLVFLSGEKVIGWPCIIGGKNSKIEQDSSCFLFETGIYEPDPIQRRENKIITTAAKRTEYGLNPFCLEEVGLKYLNLLDITPEYIQYEAFKEKKEIPFNINQIENILGVQIKEEDFIQKMIKKGYVFNKNNTITPPKNKFLTINTPNAIIEEFAINMYKNITAINLPPKYPKHPKSQNKLSEIALNEGFFECKNISLTNKEDNKFAIDNKGRQIKNFSNLNYSILRGSLLPDLINNLSWHIKNKYKYYNFFEIGLIYGEKYNKKQYKMFSAISTNQAKLRQLLTKILLQKGILYKITTNSFDHIEHASENSKFYFKNKLIAILSTLKDSLLNKNQIKECYSLEVFYEDFESIQYKNIKKQIPNSIPIYKDITFVLKDNCDIVLNKLNQHNVQYNIKSNYQTEKEKRITIEVIIHELETPTTEKTKKIIDKIKSFIPLETI